MASIKINAVSLPPLDQPEIFRFWLSFSTAASKLNLHWYFFEQKQQPSQVFLAQKHTIPMKLLLERLAHTANHTIQSMIKHKAVTDLEDINVTKANK
eukprot:Awhi_evm1s4029